VTARVRAAIVGCGPRAREHVAAYALVPEARVIAACARTREHVETFCAEMDVPGAYTDAGEMLEREAPDVVHLVTTAPDRIPLMELVARLEVPVAIVEKPIAIQAEDRARLASIVSGAETRFLVNTQLPFHSKLDELLRAVAEGAIGDVHLIDASCGSTVLDQGVHLIDLAHRFADLASPVRVFAQCAGTEALAWPEPSPDDVLMDATFEGGERMHLVAGSTAPRIGPDRPFYLHKRIAVHGSRGSVEWRMTGWERLEEGRRVDGGPLDYDAEDRRAQAALTRAALTLLTADPVPHPTRIALALSQFDTILAAYVSTLQHAPVDLPLDAPADLLGALSHVLRLPVSPR
jgi:predicted dehydrogenase